MVAQASCPGRERLQRLLDGRLPGPDQEALVAHLDGCPNCQRGIEELAAGREAWAATARYLRDGQPEPERALRQLLETPGRVDTDMNAEPNDAEVPLDFLGPTDRPGMIGRFGRYDVAGVIGRGGMGIVLKGFDPELSRTVAIKVLAPHFASSGAARRRFAREARAAAAVSHEHVVAIHDVGEVNGLPYLVMPYVAGVSLQERLDRSGPLDLPSVLRIGMQAAAGLAAAHAQGLVHRDVKPANILLENGVERVKLTDFSLARAVDDASVTHSGVIAGTPHYMAPEQAAGEAVDHRADLFSLGSVLYALCTGRLPFRAPTTLAVLKQVCEKTPRPIQEINPDVPEWLVAIIARLHEKDPARRFQSAGEVAELLGRHLARMQQGAAEEPAGQPTARRGGRWRAAAVLLLALAVPAGLAGAAAVYRIVTDKGELVVESEDPDVEVRVKQGGAVVAIVDPRSGKTVELKSGAYDVELGGGADGLRLSAQSFTLKRGEREVVRVQLEPKGGLPSPVPGPASQGRAAAPALEPVRPRLGVVSGRAPGEAATAGSQGGSRDLRPPWPRVRRLQGHGSEVLCAALPLSGRVLASGDREGAIILWNLRQEQPQVKLTGHVGPVNSIAFSPDGKVLASAGGDGTIRLWDVATGKAIRVSQRDRQDAWRQVAFAPDGRTLAAGTAGGTIELWDTTTGRALQQLETSGHGRRRDQSNPGDPFGSGGEPAGSAADALSVFSFSPDGRLLAISSGKEIGFWDVPTGKEVRRLRSDRAIGGLAFAPDGKKLASAEDGIIQLWEVTTGAVLARMETRLERIDALRVSPDGKSLAAGGGNAIQLWDVATGKLTGVLKAHSGRTLLLVFGPRGLSLGWAKADGVVLIWEVGQP